MGTLVLTSPRMKSPHKKKFSALDNVRSINDRELSILYYRLIEGRTFEEIADIFGVTRERIRQIEAKALEKIKMAIEELGFPTLQSHDREHFNGCRKHNKYFAINLEAKQRVSNIIERVFMDDYPAEANKIRLTRKNRNRLLIEVPDITKKYNGGKVVVMCYAKEDIDEDFVTTLFDE